MVLTGHAESVEDVSSVFAGTARWRGAGGFQIVVQLISGHRCCTSGSVAHGIAYAWLRVSYTKFWDLEINIFSLFLRHNIFEPLLEDILYVIIICVPFWDVENIKNPSKFSQKSFVKATVFRYIVHWLDDYFSWN